ncbi:aldo/keto reductase [Companilactobacillus sp.]|jgi:diketogulonate reductase-like aldo/keto reductase|uniref:aldo/keto reductase n=1 Tax=Companilactobacillus sp. TaxID=2767905 RepID=UPI0025C6C673|nr:aldo/keto reductase [Companilactobacillus sp.]MCH4009655.1 aldo/keto reductase [Companilactobacillus sp.]MCH4052669.1 aldo/keto reductase [Companilactobacillus sp.]MCH4077597.1 aldo/keto reductase [Companilactobacillus sp.]MCH4126173.1 aldo/keto reductase [Companilactobacillus sp.]MCI1311881.1 aldo/keto reductase [Companilactobacillus sp.]
MINSLNDRITLNNGIRMPGLGLGVYQIPDEDTAKVVADGIKAGYRLIDTAQIYGNESGTGKGIKEALAETGLNREDLFVTSKVWNNHLTYDETIEQYNNSLEKLELDYLDLYLIHWPGDNSFKESYRALEDLYKAGKIKAIGVSNFEIHHLKELAEDASVTPVLNQVESHPRMSQDELRKYAVANDIKIQAWSPLMQGQILKNETLQKIADKYNKSVAQVILRWDIQRDVMLVVKSVRPERMAANANVFDFNLDKEDIKAINDLNQNLRVGPEPDEFDFE